MTRKDLSKYLILILITLSACFLIFYRTAVCTQGIREGIYLCATTVIPSLFPFMIVSQFIMKSGLSDFIGNMLNGFTVRVFKLPGVASSIIIMSLIGGFPIGAKMTADLLDEGKLTQNQAQRLNLFCINAGPAFIIGTVGSIFLGNKKAGIILYASTCLSSILLGILSSILADKEQALSKSSKLPFMKSPITAFTSSTAESAKTMIAICSWIVLFNAIIKCFLSFGSDSYLITICSMLEVTNGIRLSMNILPIPALAAILSFAGISVHCQIFSYVNKSGLSARYFYTARILSAAFSSFICTGLLKVFPCEISTFSTTSQLTATAYSISLPSAIALILMCAILIFEVDTNKKVC